jgi:hypothetical protein
VLPEVAALPFAERVQVIASEEAPEGVWAISRMPGEGPTLGDERGRYGVDFVWPHDYGELLLLDTTSTRILRAVPLPGVPPQSLAVRDTAVYCSRQGDGGLPDSMLCRADRAGTGTLVRVFASAGPDPTVPVDRPGWRRERGSPGAYFSEVMRACPERTCVQGPDGTLAFHPVTLVAPYDRATATDTKEACRHIRAAFDAEQPVEGAHGPLWDIVTAELDDAWRAGRAAHDPDFVHNLVARGDVIDGDTQTLGEATDRLAGMCGIHIAPADG